jgi:hypothetical protein
MRGPMPAKLRTAGRDTGRQPAKTGTRFYGMTNGTGAAAESRLAKICDPREPDQDHVLS